MQLSFDFYMIEANPENLIGDRAYDSDKLDQEFRDDGIEMIAPHRKNWKPRKPQGDPSLASLRAPLASETFFAWIQWQRRLPVRWQSVNFLGFVRLACIAILLKQF